MATACLAFHRESTDDFRQDVINHIYSGNLYLALEEEIGIAAFRVIQSFPQESAIVLEGAAKHPLAQKYLIRLMTDKILASFDPIYVLTRTQNDYVVDYMKALCLRGVVPLDFPSNRGFLKLIKKTGLFHEDLDSQTLVIPGCYGGEPMIVNAPRPRSKTPQVRQFMDEINYEQGDARVIIGLRREEKL